jgi:DNA helicase-2/ATP-dependent DNA helicase PcrA
VYGSAIHKALDELITYARYHGGEKTTLEHILAVFKKELGRGRLNHTDHDRELKRGEALLPIYYEKMSGSFLGNEQVEVDMRDEGVVVGNAHLTGKIDLLRTEEGGYHVIDFKTGSAVESFDEVGLSDYEKIKVHNYKIQLIFYKLLLENSKHYKHDVAKLAIEFVESIDSKANKPLTLIYEPTQEEIDRVTKLIEIVYKKIKALDFPDTAIYDQSYKGILQFEEDLLKGSL